MVWLMNNFKLIYDYKDIDKYRLSFNSLANKTFGIDFENWYQKGQWNDRYICYSYADGDRIVANVSISKMDIIINGEVKKAIQIGTVMTDDEYRGRGLSRSLMERVIKEYETGCDFMYLFANKDVLSFYPKFGFNVQTEGQFCAEVSLKNGNSKSVRKLNPEKTEDLAIITRLSSEREPLSRKFGVLNAEGIFKWYCLNVFTDNIYYLQEEDILVLYGIEEDSLHLYDIVSKDKAEFKPLINMAAPENIKKVIFYFTPDFKDIEAEYTEGYDPDDTMFVRGNIDLIPEKFKYPITAHA